VYIHDLIDVGGMAGMNLTKGCLLLGREERVRSRLFVALATSLGTPNRSSYKLGRHVLAKSAGEFRGHLAATFHGRNYSRRKRGER
jgi:hypothetical protein